MYMTFFSTCQILFCFYPFFVGYLNSIYSHPNCDVLVMLQIFVFSVCQYKSIIIESTWSSGSPDLPQTTSKDLWPMLATKRELICKYRCAEAATRGILLKSCFKNFCNIYGKILVLESLLSFIVFVFFLFFLILILLWHLYGVAKYFYHSFNIYVLVCKYFVNGFDLNTCSQVGPT